MNPACSLREWMAHTHGFVYYTHTKAHVTLTVISASAVSLNTWTTSPELFWVSHHEHFIFLLSKTIIISYTEM